MNRVLAHTGARRLEGDSRRLFPRRHGSRSRAGGIVGGLIDAVKPARAIIEQTVAQFFAISGRLGGLAAAKGFG